VLEHEQERPVGTAPVPEEIEGEAGQDVGDVAGVPLRDAHLDQVGIVIVALAREAWSSVMMNRMLGRRGGES
jgi:hypothetical protein